MENEKKTAGKIIEIGQVQPGEKKSGFLELLAGEPGVPVTVICGSRPGKTALVTAGVHAGEYVGIQTAIALAGELSPEEVSGRIILVKTVCRENFEKRYGSIVRRDHTNLNRVFPGREDGSFSQRLACAVVEKLQSLADYYIDLHSGDDYEELTPYVYYAGKAEPQVSQLSREMARQADVSYMVRSNVASGGSYNYAASRGIPSVLLERGGMGAWSMEEVQSMKKDVRNILDFLGICKSGDISRSYYPLEITEVEYQAASHFGCWYPKRHAGDLITEGETLGTVRDYEGKVQEVSVADYSGVILYQTASLQVEKDGPMVAYGKIDYESDDRKERIASYWSRRSESFVEQRRQELHSPLAGRFLEQLKKYLPEKPLKILDVGCGTGFFTILLTRAGYEVTGVDLTPDMIRYAEKLAGEEQVSCSFQVMDAEKLEFADESFDAVVTRNLTWTLPHAKRAYREWLRVLKPGGVLLNFDANYGSSDFTDTQGLPEGHAHNRVGHELMEECERIKRQLPINSCVRPGWDVEILGEAGAKSLSIDLMVSEKLYLEKDDFYNPTPLFLICVQK